MLDDAISPRERRGEETQRTQSDELIKNRNRLETALRHYQELFERAPDAYIVSDAEGTIREAKIGRASCRERVYLCV